MTEPALRLPPDAEAVRANRHRERLLVRVSACLWFAGAVCFALYYLLQSHETLSLLVGIAAATFAGLGTFVVLAIVWRRACGWRGHAFREADVFPDGSVTVYECRHCGEYRYVSRAASQKA